jgi:hypothetical protein
VITVTATVAPIFTGLLTNSAVIATCATESMLENDIAQVTAEVAPYTVYLPVVTKRVE